MKQKHVQPAQAPRAFTLVEMLVVISIIAILAAMLLPVVSIMKTKAKAKMAQLEMAQTVNDITRYYTDYHRYPTSTNAMSAANLKAEDFTFFDGTTQMNSLSTSGVNYEEPNSMVMAILMDWTDPIPGAWPNPNWNHQKNPQQTKYSSPNPSGYSGTGGNPLPGIDNNRVYRDPWGTPYVISLDLNYDDKCMDAVYRLKTVSQSSGTAGINGLINSVDSGGNGNHFAYNGGIMMWSFGPDKNYSPTANANVPPNKDNILSWKP